MKIGDLLKEYRLSQGKNQHEFVGKVLTQSYYSKVENNRNQITAQSLIELLELNDISVSSFVQRLSPAGNNAQLELQRIGQMMTEAYYSNNLKKMDNVKQIIKESSLPESEKESQMLIASGLIELMDNQKIRTDKKLQDKLKNKIFDIPDFNQTKLMLYCDFMRFYDLESNKLITQTILKQYENTSDTNIQKLLLAIITNLLIFSIEEDNFDDLEKYIDYSRGIKTIPDLFFYKLALSFFKNLVQYKVSRDSAYKDDAKDIINILRNTGMAEYSDKLLQYMKKHS